jgi:PAS domain S-box-containing protein
MIDDLPVTTVPGPAAWTSEQFAAILGSVADGITVQGSDGRLVYANQAALALLGMSSLEQLLALRAEEVLGRFEVYDERGRTIGLGGLPGRQVLRGEPAPPLTIRFRVVATGAERWSVVQARALTDDRGDVALVVNTFHDITDRVLAERENRVQAHLLDEVRAAVFATTASGRITRWNRHAERLLGISAATARGRSLVDVLGAGREDELRQALADVGDGARWEREWAVPSIDGSMTPLFVTLAPAETARELGDGDGIVGVALDITERRRAEDELRAHAERRDHEQQVQAFLADASRLLSESLDMDVTIERLARLAVPTIADWCGIDLLDETGQLRQVGIAHVDPSRVELARHLRERYPPDPAEEGGVYGVLRSGRSVLVPRIPDGFLDGIADPALRDTIVELQLHGYMTVPLQSRSGPLGVISFVAAESGRTFDADDLAIAEDLAARAAAALENARLYHHVSEAQAGLRRLADSEHERAAELNAVIGAMGEGVLVVQPDGRVTLANPAVAAVLPGPRIETYDDVVGRLRSADRERTPGLDGRPESADVRVDGPQERWVELSTYPVLESDGATAPVRRETIVLVRDVTAARQRQAVRDTFIGVLSHELRTPITTIFAGAKVLARPNGLSEDRRAELFTDISVEAERLQRLVEDVIALNRFGEAEGGEVGNEPVLLQRLLPGVVAAEEPRWPDATFTIDLPSGLPTVTADKTYVEQVARNLLSNAAKYGGAGARVRLTAEADADEVRVRVLDNGPGYPAAESDRLFELFYRSPATSGSVGGAGIGLFVCARLIAAMGGRMWSRLRPEGGAEFGFALRVMTED